MNHQNSRRVRLAALLAVLATAAMLLCACGGGGDNAGAEPDQPTPGVDCATHPEQCK